MPAAAAQALYAVAGCTAIFLVGRAVTRLFEGLFIAVLDRLVPPKDPVDPKDTPEAE